MKSLIMLWQVVARELATRCSTSATMDCKTVLGRCKHEGLSFLTITLPAFGKDFEKSLDQGRVDRNLFQGFSWQAGLPRFLGGFLDLVFDRHDGALLDEPSIDAIQAVRQLTQLSGKLFLVSSEARQEAAMSGYIQCEKEVRANDAAITQQMLRDFKRISSLLYDTAFTRVEKDLYAGKHRPAHGPGATADGLRGNSKFRQKSWPMRLEEMFPAMEHLLPSPSYWEELDEIDFLEPGREIPVRVISVPKTMKTPRIIGIEPTAMQYAQQAVLPLILESLSKGENPNNPNGLKDSLDWMLGFDDQEPNQLMAAIGSTELVELATLDLSEASDRVSNQLVRCMLSNFPWFSKAVDACRSRKADVPGHGVIRLAKFASMGSALCFPMEAMVFLTIVFLGIEDELNARLTKKDIESFKGAVRIYGDDIIIPVDYVHAVIARLEAFGLRVNRDKSFWTGQFRESCGKEYFNGHDVSIVKVRQMPPTSRHDVTEVISWASLRNQFYWQGMWETAKWLDEYMTRILKFWPMVHTTSPVLGRESVMTDTLEYFKEYVTRTHPDLQSPLVKGYVVSAKPPIDPLDGHAALLKFFLKKGDMPIVDEKHLERSGRPHAVNIKLRWASPF